MTTFVIILQALVIVCFVIKDHRQSVIIQDQLDELEERTRRDIAEINGEVT